MLTHLTNLMSKWSSFPLAWMGRMTLVKLTILPKILYLFHVLPKPVLGYFLCLQQRRASFDILNSTRPCSLQAQTSLSTLRCPTDPTPKYSATSEIPLWVFTESVKCDPLSVVYLFWLQPSDCCTIPNYKPFFRTTLNQATLSNLPTTRFYPSSTTQLLAWTSPTSFLAWSSANLIHAYKFMDFTGIKPFPSLC